MNQKDKKCVIEEIKKRLDQAIDAGDIEMADRLTTELLEQQKQEPKKHMPDQFSESLAKKACCSGEKRTAKKRRKLFIALAAVLIAILSIGTIAYASGIIFPKIENKDGSDTPVNAALDSAEYKAAKEYNQYLDSLSDEELEKTADYRDDAVYDLPGKVKEICKKYHLKYAAKMTEFKDYREVVKELKARELSGLLGEKLKKSLKETMKASTAGYYFDDGNLHLEIVVDDGDDQKENGILTLNVAPEGSFPWMGFSSNQGASDDEEKTLYTLQSKDGILFTCAEDGDNVRAFGKTGNHYITIGVSKTWTEAQDKAFEKQRSKLMATLDRSVQEKTELDSYLQLQEKLGKGIKTASEENPKAMQKALEGDSKLYWSLMNKYGGLTAQEQELYKDCGSQLEKLYGKWDAGLHVSREDMKEYLDLLNLEKS